LTDVGYREGKMCRPLLLRLMALFALLCPAAGHSATVAAATTPAIGKAQILLPSSFIKLMDMDFGMLTVTGAGTAILDSSTDAVTTTGGVLLVGGRPHAARFDAVSPARNVVKISLPKKAVTLTRVGGTETMILDTWSINGAATRNVVAHEEFQFRVAGTLHVNANQVEGTYLGTFDVTINYN
jgi:spore coat protein U-like protein